MQGTDVYDSKRGAYTDLGVLDVQQIFGRAGRPQFDKEGHGIIITSHDRLAHYLSLLTRQMPIESKLPDHLVDCLNAEISLGTVTSLEEALNWLNDTYLNIRMRVNPLAYGIPVKRLQVNLSLSLSFKLNFTISFLTPICIL